MFKKLQNEGKADRIIRIILGLVFFLISLTYFSGNIQTILFILAALLIITGITGICLLYLPFGIKTKK
ncbi:MAG TPA: DUF2892 domain-containing protein [Patescibacteria group bacterium]